jgi:hypothetical protein
VARAPLTRQRTFRQAPLICARVRRRRCGAMTSRRIQNGGRREIRPANREGNDALLDPFQGDRDRIQCRRPQPSCYQRSRPVFEPACSGQAREKICYT